jgi:hypothetical protein
MKVTKWVEFAEEVEIEITGADAMAAVLDDGCSDDPLELRLLRVVNKAGTFLRALSDEQIRTLLNDDVRKIIADFFQIQAERFQPQLSPDLPEGYPPCLDDARFDAKPRSPDAHLGAVES